MQTFTIRAPDGRTIDISAPDQATAIQGAQSWVQANPKPQGSSSYQAARQRMATGGLGEKVAGVLANVNHAIPFSQEAGAALGTAFKAGSNALLGQPTNLGSEFQSELDSSRGLTDQYQQEHPYVASAARGVGLAAQLAPALASGGAAEAPVVANAMRTGFVAASKRIALGTARNAVTGGAYGAVNGAAQPGTLGERTQNAVAGIVPGAALGVAVPAALAGGAGVAKGIGRLLAKPAVSIAAEAGNAISRAVTGKTAAEQAATISPQAQQAATGDALDQLAAKGVTPQALRQAVAEAHGKPITTAEAVGASGITTGSRLVRRAGTSPDVGDAVMANRSAGRGDRILADLHQATGVDPRTANASIDDVVAQGQAQAKPLYDLAVGDPHPIWNSQLDSLSKRPAISDAIRSAVSSAQNAGRDPNALGLTFMQDPDPTNWDVAKAPVPEQAYAFNGSSGAAPSQGKSLLKFIADNGGMKDDGGELASIGANKWHVGRAFQRSVAGGDSADTPDGWALKAQEAGYLPAGDRPTPSDLFSAMDQEMRGKPVYARQLDAAGQTKADNIDSASRFGPPQSDDVPSEDQYQGSPSPPGTSPVPTVVPTGQTWQDVKQALMHSIEWDPLKVLPKNFNANKDLQTAYSDLTSTLHDPETGVPGLKAADTAAGDYLSHGSARKDFSGTLFSRNVSADKFDSMVSGLPDGVLPTAKATVLNDIYNGVLNGTVKPSLFNVPAVKAKLGSMFGDDTASTIASKMHVEAKMQAAEGRLRPNVNSTTGDVIGGEADNSDHLAGAVTHGLMGNPVGAAKGLIAGTVRNAVGAAMTSGSQASRNAMGDLLFADPGTVADLLAARANAPAPPPVGPKSIAATANAMAITAGQNTGSQNGQSDPSQ